MVPAIAETKELASLMSFILLAHGDKTFPKGHCWWEVAEQARGFCRGYLGETMRMWDDGN